MSDSVKNFQQEQKRVNELLLKKKEIEEARINYQHDLVINAKKKSLDFKKLSVDSFNEEDVTNIVRENDDYMEAAKDGICFIMDEFKNAVPYFRSNLILIGANTGEGKSTTSANIIYKTLQQGRKVLAITNEEKSSDVYNRITCLKNEWIYTNHDKFTPDQKEVFRKNIPLLSKGLIVIDNNYKGLTGVTTTLEGFIGFMESLLTSETKFGAIVVDYIQNISRSIENPRLQKWEILARVAEFLNDFKNKYPAPIIILAQLHNSKSNEEKSFEERLKGFRGMLEVVTCAIEVRADRKNLRTEWIIHKNRWFSELNGQGLMTGWYKGRYVSLNNPSYMVWAKQKQAERAQREREKINARVSGTSPGTGSSTASSGAGSPGGTG